MITEKIELYKTREIGERINVSFAFMKQNGKQIAKNFLYLLPFVIVAAIFSAYTQSGSFSSFSIYSTSPLTSIGGTWIILGAIVAMIATNVVSFLSYLFVTSFVTEYEASPDGIVADSDVWARVRDSFWGSVGGSILIGLAVAFGLIFCVIPGIWIGVSFSVFYVAYLNGRKNDVAGGVIDCMSESYYLIKSDWFPSFGYLIVVAIITYVIYIVFYIPSMIISFTMALAPDGSAMNGTFTIIFCTLALILVYVAYLFMSIITGTASAFLYFDLKERNEGVSLQNKIDNIGQPNS